MKQKKKICFIAQFPPPIHGLSKAVEMLYNSKLSKEFKFEKINITNNKNIIKNIIKIWRSKADLFYFTISQTKGGNLRDLVIFKLLSMQKKKCLIHLHGGYYRQLVENDLPAWQKKANYKAISNLEGAIVLGSSLKTIFEGMLPNEKIFIVPNCIDNQFLISNDEFDRKVSFLNNKRILHVLYLSNFIKTKGYPEVLEMARLEKEHVETDGEKRFHFDFAGKFFKESEKEFFENYVKEHDLQDYVTYHGIVGGQEKRDLLELCDIFVLLTRYPNEGQPISILEAMGNGMFIVTTDHAGIPDVVVNGENGLVVSGKPCLEKLLEDISVTREILITNRHKIGNMFSEKGYLENMGKIFSLLEGVKK